MAGQYLNHYLQIISHHETEEGQLKQYKKQETESIPLSRTIYL